MRLLYGTGNAAKLDSMRCATKSLAGRLEIISPAEAGITLPDVEEDGNSPIENAEIKARAYYEAAHAPVFSCDSGLYAEGLPDELQPGVHIRRVGGRRLSDKEMTDYYAGLSAKYGKGRLICRYINAICLVTDRGAFKHTGDDISSGRFIIADKPHPARVPVPGFPLDPLSIDIKTGLYYFDLEDQKAEKGLYAGSGFADFFIRSLGL